MAPLSPEGPPRPPEPPRPAHEARKDRVVVRLERWLRRAPYSFPNEVSHHTDYDGFAPGEV